MNISTREKAFASGQSVADYCNLKIESDTKKRSRAILRDENPKPMAFITTRYRMLFKALEIGGSAVFLFLCVKAFCSHFYNDLKRLVQKRRAKKLRPSTT
jgi:hypothetical protein